MWVKKHQLGADNEQDEREFWSRVDPNERVMQVEVLRQRYMDMQHNKMRGTHGHRLRRSARIIFQAWR